MPPDVSLNIYVIASTSILKRMRKKICIYCACLEVMIIINQFIFKPFRPEGTPFEDGKQLTSVPSIILVNIASVNAALL